MRAIAAVALSLALTTAPALAQVVASDISDTADRDFWCAAAFGTYSYVLKTSGDEAGAAKANQDMQTLFTGLVMQMQAKGMSRADYDALVQVYTGRAMDPFVATAYSQETCNTAVTEVELPAPGGGAMSAPAQQ